MTPLDWIVLVGTIGFIAIYGAWKSRNVSDVETYFRGGNTTSWPTIGLGIIFGFPLGGPCTQGETACIGGPQQGASCNGNDALCDSSPGAGDGDCDACPLAGGFRTEDEMFILFGNYWVTKNQ